MKYLLIILGIFSVLYGILVLQVGSGTGFWLIWEVIGLFFFLLVFMIHKKVFIHYRKIGITFHVFVAVAITVLAVLCGMIASDFSAKGNQNLDYLIVLGAQVRKDGPSVVLRYRLDAAIHYLNENLETVCIVSGGQGVNEPFSEAKGMADYLIENGIDENRILLEEESRNTVQNIENSKTLMKESYDGVGIVTNNFHVFRAVQIAKVQGLEGVCGIAADSNALYLPNNILRECLGILKDWLMKNI